ncbi:unnamed protein product [Mytilus edulis]|uniref:Uncharacterized protein n=1 Tax=Mytilus edulis TaxID=6550 RepID=A0A8S3QFN1_MYTED|nr:unnamed protein product [Mytilus edulis]
MCCSCFNSSDIQLTRTTNLSSCKTANDETVLIYKINRTLIPHETVQGLCSTLKCTGDGSTIMSQTTCKQGNINIQGVCGNRISEDGMQSNLGKYWGLTQNQTFENCWNQNKLLLNSSACQYFGRSLQSRAWTNIFREEIEVEQTLVNDCDLLGNRTALPTFCLSANFSESDKGDHVLTMHRRDCSKQLEWFVCKKIKGHFAESNTQNYEESSRVNFSTTTYDDLDSTKHKNTTVTSTTNRTFDIDESSTPVYEEVNKN